MKLKYLVSKQSVDALSRFNRKASFRNFGYCRNVSDGSTSFLQSHYLANLANAIPLGNLINTEASFLTRCFHFSGHALLSQSAIELQHYSGDSVDDEEEVDGAMNEFLSRFVWAMRPRIAESFPGCDKKTMDEMLLVIIQKVVEQMDKGGIKQTGDSSSALPSLDLSEDLWVTVGEVSEAVLKDMEKEKKKDSMKKFLQAEEVLEMCRFAGEIGIRGNLLKQLRFKWAKEKMEEREFYDSLNSLREKSEAGEGESAENIAGEGESVVSLDKQGTTSLPKRKGKIKYKIYGLDLSDKRWSEVSDRIHEAGSVMWPQEPKPMSGKCKLVMERLLSMNEEDDPSSLLAEWAELLQPGRIDWMALLDLVQERNSSLYLKVAESILDEKSFEADVRDYSKVIAAHAKAGHLEDAERLLKKMDENGFIADILTLNVLVHMYSKSGNIDRATEVFESLRKHGFEPDVTVYNSMIMAYVNASKPKLGESLIREMEARDIKPTKEAYMALLQSFAQRGEANAAARIENTMQFAGYQPGLESCTLLVEAYGKSGKPDEAQSKFDYMRRLGHKPDDRCIASLITAYQKSNLLDKALNLLIELEKEGMDIGSATFSVLVVWMGKLGLVTEAEHFVAKISELGEAPPFEVHVSLCDMYARAQNEKKTLQTLEVLEAKKEQLGYEEFETVIYGLIAGGFVQDARRIQKWMEACGFTPSERVNVALMTSQTFSSRKQPAR